MNGHIRSKNKKMNHSNKKAPRNNSQKEKQNKTTTKNNNRGLQSVHDHTVDSMSSWSAMDDDASQS